MKAVSRSELVQSDRKRSYNRRLFGIVAPKYDVVTRALSFFRDSAWKREMVASLPAPNAADHAQPGGSPRALDLACGTGDLCELLAERYPSYAIDGLDLTEEMLVRARRRVRRRADAPARAWVRPRPPVRRDQINFVKGSMDELPYREGSFLVVTGGYALRNAPDLDATLREIFRVLTPDGIAAFLDFSRSPRAWFWAIEYRLLRWWGGLWGLVLHRDATVYAYIARSLTTFPDRLQLKRKLREHGFVRVRSRLRMFGFLAITTFRKPAPSGSVRSRRHQAGSSASRNGAAATVVPALKERRE